MKAKSHAELPKSLGGLGALVLFGAALMGMSVLGEAYIIYLISSALLLSMAVSVFNFAAQDLDGRKVMSRLAKFLFLLGTLSVIAFTASIVAQLDYPQSPLLGLLNLPVPFLFAFLPMLTCVAMLYTFGSLTTSVGYNIRRIGEILNSRRAIKRMLQIDQARRERLEAKSAEEPIEDQEEYEPARRYESGGL